MLFWIFVIIFIISTIIAICIDKSDRIVSELAYTIPKVIASISFFVALVMSIFLIIAYTTSNGHSEECRQQFSSLVYQAENGMYDKEPYIGKYQLMQDIQDWNEDLAYYKTEQRNFWIGIFIPNIYDEFSYISPILMESYEDNERTEP